MKSYMAETQERPLRACVGGRNTEGRRVVKVGLHFDLNSRTLDGWAVEG